MTAPRSQSSHASLVAEPSAGPHGSEGADAANGSQLNAKPDVGDSQVGTWKVWDEEHETEHGARVWPAEEFSDHESAAHQYAEEDVDGKMDDVYSHSHPLLVRCPTGELWRVNVRLSWDPVGGTVSAEAISEQEGVA
jgi:hypothetical protein